MDRDREDNEDRESHLDRIVSATREALDDTRAIMNEDRAGDDTVMTEWGRMSRGDYAERRARNAVMDKEDPHERHARLRREMVTDCRDAARMVGQKRRDDRDLEQFHQSARAGGTSVANQLREVDAIASALRADPRRGLEALGAKLGLTSIDMINALAPSVQGSMPQAISAQNESSAYTAATLLTERYKQELGPEWANLEDAVTHILQQPGWRTGRMDYDLHRAVSAAREWHRRDVDRHRAATAKSRHASRGIGNGVSEASGAHGESRPYKDKYEELRQTVRKAAGQL